MVNQFGIELPNSNIRNNIEVEKFLVRLEMTYRQERSLLQLTVTVCCRNFTKIMQYKECYKMKKWYRYIGIVMMFRYLWKWYLLLRLKTDIYIGFEYYWALKRYEDFEPQ